MRRDGELRAAPMRMLKAAQQVVDLCGLVVHSLGQVDCTFERI